jgi:hypothetical protein
MVHLDRRGRSASRRVLRDRGDGFRLWVRECVWQREKLFRPSRSSTGPLDGGSRERNPRKSHRPCVSHGSTQRKDVLGLLPRNLLAVTSPITHSPPRARPRTCQYHLVLARRFCAMTEGVVALLDCLPAASSLKGGSSRLHWPQRCREPYFEIIDNLCARSYKNFPCITGLGTSHHGVRTTIDEWNMFWEEIE